MGSGHFSWFLYWSYRDWSLDLCLGEKYFKGCCLDPLYISIGKSSHFSLFSTTCLDQWKFFRHLHTKKKITQITVGLLESHPSWIFVPTHVRVSFSNNSKDFQNEKTIALYDGERNGNPNRKVAKISNIELSSRFIRVQAINRKICPEWHDGAGGGAWIFADEIIVE